MTNAYGSPDRPDTPSRARRRAVGAVLCALVALHACGAGAEPSQLERMAHSVLMTASEGSTWEEVLAALIVSAPNARRTIDPADDASAEELAAKGIDRQLRVNVGPPTATLSVWVMNEAPTALKRGGAARGTVLVLPGIFANKWSMHGLAHRLSSAGFRTVLVDLRGQGRSSGKYLTYGVFDSRDLSQVIDALEREKLIAGPVGVFGQSYGAAVAHQLAAADPRVEAVVGQSSFSSLRAVVPIYARNYLPVLGKVMTRNAILATLDTAGTLADFDPSEACPIKAIQKSKVPTLLIHGTADTSIPIEQARAMRDAAPNHAQLIEVDGASHDSGFGSVVNDAAVAWFERHLDLETPVER